MQNNIPGAVILKDNNILLCKAKLEESTHWSEKMVLLLQLSPSRVALRKRKEPEEQTFKQNNGNVLELLEPVNSSHEQKTS